MGKKCLEFARRMHYDGKLAILVFVLVEVESVPRLYWYLLVIVKGVYVKTISFALVILLLLKRFR